MHFSEKIILEKYYTKLDFLNFSVIKKIKVIDTKIKIYKSCLGNLRICFIMD
jgi:hypothetical protein